MTVLAFHVCTLGGQQRDGIRLLHQYAQNIEAQIDPANVDTSGFFDDAALRLGDDYALFGELVFG